MCMGFTDPCYNPSLNGMSAENDKKCIDNQGDPLPPGTRLKSLSLRCNIWHPIVTTGQTRGVGLQK